MKKVMVFGTFDLLHKGHINFLKQASGYGRLIVTVATDNNVQKLKGRKSVNTLNTRIKQIQELNIAEEVVAGYEDDFFRIIQEKQPDIICLGYDQDSYGVEELQGNVEIIKLKPYKEDKYKSSFLRDNY